MTEYPSHTRPVMEKLAYKENEAIVKRLYNIEPLRKQCEPIVMQMRRL